MAQSNFDDLKGLESVVESVLELAIFFKETWPTSEWYTKLGETVG